MFTGGLSVVGLQPSLRGLPTAGDFGGAGLNTITRTNPNGLAADGDMTQANTMVGGALTTQPSSSPLMWVAIAIGALLVVKFWSERRGSDHVSDIKIGITNLLILAVMVAIARHISIGVAGVATKYNIPGSTQAARFFSL